MPVPPAGHGAAPDPDSLARVTRPAAQPHRGAAWPRDSVTRPGSAGVAHRRPPARPTTAADAGPRCGSASTPLTPRRCPARGPGHRSPAESPTAPRRPGPTSRSTCSPPPSRSATATSSRRPPRPTRASTIGDAADRPRAGTPRSATWRPARRRATAVDPAQRPRHQRRAGRLLGGRARPRRQDGRAATTVADGRARTFMPLMPGRDGPRASLALVVPVKRHGAPGTPDGCWPPSHAGSGRSAADGRLGPAARTQRTSAGSRSPGWSTRRCSTPPVRSRRTTRIDIGPTDEPRATGRPPRRARPGRRPRPAVRRTGGPRATRRPSRPPAAADARAWLDEFRRQAGFAHRPHRAVRRPRRRRGAGTATSPGPTSRPAP